MDRRRLLVKNKILDKIKMKKDWHDSQHFLPEGPGDEGSDGFGCEEWDPSDMVTLLEDFCEGFTHEQKIGFLRSQGFNIINRKDKTTGDSYDVAYLPENALSTNPKKSRLPAEPNIDPLFVEKVGDCILKILSKYGK